MKKLIMFSGALLILFTTNLFAADFPKCKEACGRYYTCTLSVHPNATEEQKSMVQKGCNFNCNKPKYYNRIVTCMNAGSDCKTFATCIQKEMGPTK